MKKDWIFRVEERSLGCGCGCEERLGFWNWGENWEEEGRDWEWVERLSRWVFIHEWPCLESKQRQRERKRNFRRWRNESEWSGLLAGNVILSVFIYLLTELSKQIRVLIFLKLVCFFFTRWVMRWRETLAQSVLFHVPVNWVVNADCLHVKQHLIFLTKSVTRSSSSLFYF